MLSKMLGGSSSSNSTTNNAPSMASSSGSMSSVGSSTVQNAPSHPPSNNNSHATSNNSHHQTASAAASIYRARLKEKEHEVATLQERVHSLSAQLQSALTHGTPGKNKKRRHIPLSPHAMHVSEERHGNTNKITMTAQRERLGRNASIATRQVLDHLVETENAQNTSNNSLYGHHHHHHPQHASSSSLPAPLQRIISMFQNPTAHLEYLNSQVFAKDLYKVTTKVRNLLEREPRVVYLQSPTYVLGDIHGNLEDLHFFSDNIWRLGMNLTAGNFLFLGDYVDRGLQCLECVAYLFAMKLQNPTKVVLLRGNHETRDVNGWEEHYGERSFIYQCRARFGDDIGYRLWEVINQAFDRLPLAAVIDNDIFCVHGGIPRPVSDNATGTTTSRIQDILTVPKVAGINPPYEHEEDKYQQVASDCIWSDPASEDQELTTVDPMTGYGESLRGGGAICFGHKAVTQFLEQNNFSYIMRAHEAHAEGVAVAKGARVFTVFSTSKDHNQGSQAMAGCILVDNDKLQVINRSPAYKNQYIHRRDSVSLANLSEPEIQKRMQLGLVTNDAASVSEQDADNGGAQEMEEWQDFDSSSDDSVEAASAPKVAVANDASDYIFDKQRRSSVDLNSLSEHSHDSAADAKLNDWLGNGNNLTNTRNSSYGSGTLKRDSSSTLLGGAFATIREEETTPHNKSTDTNDADEIDTVDGSDDDMGDASNN